MGKKLAKEDGAEGCVQRGSIRPEMSRVGFGTVLVSYFHH